MAIETYDITTDLSDQDIYPDVLHQDALDAGLSTLTAVDANAKGNGNKVRFHFPAPLSAPDKTTLDGVVASYDPTGTQPSVSHDGSLVLEDIDASTDEKIWTVATDDGTLQIATCTDAGDVSSSAIEVTRTGTAVNQVDIKAPLMVIGEVTASTPTSGTSLTTKSYVDALAQGVEWQDSVASGLDDPPGSPTAGLRHLVGTGTGDWSGQGDSIAEYNGASWDFTAPVQGMTLPLGS